MRHFYFLFHRILAYLNSPLANGGLSILLASTAPSLLYYNLYYYFNTELKNELVLRGIDISIRLTSLIRKEYINDYKKKETL